MAAEGHVPQGQAVGTSADKPLLLGTKYQSTAPSVSDGQAVYILVDAAGRVILTGQVASDEPAVGAPVQVGGVVDDTSPATAAEADARAFRATPEGNQIFELYKDNVAIGIGDANGQQVQGAAASDAAELGNPVLMGGSVDDTTPAAAAEGDARSFRSTPEGNQIVELYKDNNALSPISAMPGAGDVKQSSLKSATNSSEKATLATPASGKKIRIVSIFVTNISSTGVQVEIYFAAGTNFDSAASKRITAPYLDLDNAPDYAQSWPDGAGPVGLADDVISLRTSADISSNLYCVVFYREE